MDNRKLVKLEVEGRMMTFDCGRGITVAPPIQASGHIFALGTDIVTDWAIDSAGQCWVNGWPVPYHVLLEKAKGAPDEQWIRKTLQLEESRPEWEVEAREKGWVKVEEISTIAPVVADLTRELTKLRRENTELVSQLAYVRRWASENHPELCGEITEGGQRMLEEMARLQERNRLLSRKVRSLRMRQPEEEIRDAKQVLRKAADVVEAEAERILRGQQT